MRLKEKRGSLMRIVLWALLIANMAAIFLLSARTADESTVQSDVFAEVPMAVYDSTHPEKAGNEDVFKLMQIIVRKTAHFLEFAALSVWAVGLGLSYEIRLPYIAGAAFSALYAATDEWHQLFVPERECKLTDWLIDAAGAIAAAAVIYFILKKKKQRAEGCVQKTFEGLDKAP